jgi:tRNA A-37 threonylcarbamoyl transferase component Bud32
MHGLGSLDLELCSPNVHSLLSSAIRHFSAQSTSQEDLQFRLNKEIQRLIFFYNRGYSLETCHARTWLHTVYRGIRLSDDREVAVKLLTLENFPDVIRAFEIDETNMIRRFQREVRILGCLKRQQGVVTIIDSGEIDGIPYHVCNWVEGEPLSEILAHGNKPISLRNTLTIGLRVARIVQRLHKANIVHRDIAPDHLYLRPSSRSIYIIDFGMAELISENCASDVQRYISHDIFATGLILYEVWLGRSCFTYGDPELPNQVLHLLRDPKMETTFYPISGLLRRSLASDVRVADRLSEKCEPYTVIDDLITDVEGSLRRV